jgi:peptide/nickel transport system substrate-binding protein
MDDTQRRVDDIRGSSSELENHLIDEFASGRLTRREFVRRGTVVGMSIPMLSFLVSACGGDEEGTGTGTEQRADVRPGGTLRTGIIAPSAALDPLKVGDEGGLAVLGQSGEYLTWSDEKLELQPRLAESWEPNEDGSVWTFKVRQGVTFHDGRPLTAQDVAATMNVLSDPDVGSNALSAFGGVLSANAAEATDDATVVFTLDAPNGNFPYLVSSDNYNAIILPADFDGGWDKTFIGTGPWKLEKYTPEVGVTYVKNPDYWDPNRQPNADRNEVRFYAEEQARVLALQGDEVDVLSNFSIAGGQALLTDPNVTVIEVRASQHRQIHMRNDKEPFTDKRVRQAMALLFNRQELVDGLFEGKADLGNDSPFAPVFPSTDTNVTQREQDIEQAKQLIADSGVTIPSGLELRTWDGFEIPQLAQLMQDAASQAGVTFKLNITDPGTYYGDFTYGNSPWLDSTFGITDYGHRGVPNVFLGAPLTSKGTWNSAHFRNAQYDELVAQYAAALDVDSQRGVARQIQELLLDETPLIIPYFYFHLGAMKKTVSGVEVTGMGHFDVNQAGFTS